MDTHRDVSPLKINDHAYGGGPVPGQNNVHVNRSRASKERTSAAYVRDTSNPLAKKINAYK